MASSGRIKIRLNSTGVKKNGKKTGYFKTTTKIANVKEKLRKRMFDPMAINPKTGKVGVHVMFEEGKIKK